MKAPALFAVAVAMALAPACSAAKEPWRNAAEVIAQEPVQSLAEAACAGDAARVREHLAKGVAVDAAGKAGVTPLIWTLACRGLEFNDIRANRAVAGGTMLAGEPVDPDYLAAIAALLEAGADPNRRIDGDFGPIYPGASAYWLDGRSAVLIASEFHEADVLALLLAHGGDPHAAAPEDQDWALSLAYDRGRWLDLGPQLTPDRAWAWANLHLLLQAGAKLEQAEGNQYNIAEQAAMGRPRLALQLLEAYPYEGEYETFAYHALNRIEQGFPGPEDSRALLAFLEGAKGVDLDAVRQKYRMAPYNTQPR